MSDISERAIAAAIDVLNGADGQPWWSVSTHSTHKSVLNLALHLQQVSDAAKAAVRLVRPGVEREVVENSLAPFILPDPVDPLLIEAKNLTDEGFGRAISLGRGPVEDI